MYVRRDLESKFMALEKHYPVMALVGPRQSGKTTMLKNLMKNYDASYISFDDPDVRRLFSDDIKKFARQYMDGHELTVLDEVQYAEAPGQNLKYLADSGYKMWVTSSSEILLSRDVLSYLVGRVGILHLYPFNLTEFLRANGIRIEDEKILERAVWEHAIYGGYPHAVLTKGSEIKWEILKNLHQTILLKDILRIFSIADAGAMERLSKYLAINSGTLVSYENITNLLGLSFRTLKKYTDALAKSGVVCEVPPFFTNRTRELTKKPKMYFVDTGLRNAVAGERTMEISGQLFENYVFSELLKMDLEIKYWRTKSKSEVDFVVDIDGKLVPIEVKLQASMRKVERGMRSFIEKYAPEVAVVICHQCEREETLINGTTVKYVPIWKFQDVVKK